MPSDDHSSEDLLVETTRGAFVRVRLRDAVASVAREMLRLDGIERGEVIKLSLPVDRRAVVTVLVEHEDDFDASAGCEGCSASLRMLPIPASKYGPS